MSPPFLRRPLVLATAASLLAVATLVPLVAHFRSRPPRPPAPIDREESEERSRAGAPWRDRHQWLHGGDPGPEAFAHLARLYARGLGRLPANRNASSGLSLPWWQIGPLDFGSIDSPYQDLDRAAGRIISIAPHPTDP